MKVLLQEVRLERLLEKARTLPNLCEGERPHVLPGAYKLAQGENYVGAFWYNFKTKELFYKADSTHFADDFREVVPGFKSRIHPIGWARGRVGKYGQGYFMFIYDDPDQVLPGNVVEDIYNKVVDRCGVPISYCLDHEGYDLLSESHVEELFKKVR